MIVIVTMVVLLRWFWWWQNTPRSPSEPILPMPSLPSRPFFRLVWPAALLNDTLQPFFWLFCLSQSRRSLLSPLTAPFHEIVMIGAASEVELRSNGLLHQALSLSVTNDSSGFQAGSSNQFSLNLPFLRSCCLGFQKFELELFCGSLLSSLLVRISQFALKPLVGWIPDLKGKTETGQSLLLFWLGSSTNWQVGQNLRCGYFTTTTVSQPVSGKVTPDAKLASHVLSRKVCSSLPATSLSCTSAALSSWNSLLPLPARSGSRLVDKVRGGARGESNPTIILTCLTMVLHPLHAPTPPPCLYDLPFSPQPPFFATLESKLPSSNLSNPSLSLLLRIHWRQAFYRESLWSEREMWQFGQMSFSFILKISFSWQSGAGRWNQICKCCSSSRLKGGQIPPTAAN